MISGANPRLGLLDVDPTLVSRAILVDLDDAHLLANKYHAAKSNRTWYALRNVKSEHTKSGRSTRHLHRDIYPEHAGQVDHINGNGLDNRRCNLRLCSPSENRQNARLRADSSTGVKGVSWERARNKFVAYVHANGRCVFREHFETLEEASEAVVAARKRIHGGFANHG